MNIDAPILKYSHELLVNAHKFRDKVSIVLNQYWQEFQKIDWGLPKEGN